MCICAFIIYYECFMPPTGRFSANDEKGSIYYHIINIIYLSMKSINKHAAVLSTILPIL